ncbi:Msa family membrane protein [Staphylococcus pseudintermedius]|uniref:Msa family membrane protein n=1 Tax=Staphylococcus pseudintermedius TaxID=283734 RepID=UPI001931C7CE|nr:Msa family membrane protein [Staphylococcus pseudintermedius]MCE5527446.1 Msa family membrane protein [Staphylococcus pseudintermedius]MCE5615930.1 Msa family membrane protein [Staphylococcus pseudintermedius]MCE5668772.1 Msa family membrane protein [Staphylococcus pseudintermedius]MCE5811289.1 Msa family membrane protein [Staphylococcus pseudintermedius]
MFSKRKVLLLSLISNILLSIVMSVINVNLGIITMIFGIILIPVLLNFTLLCLSNKVYNIASIFFMSFFNLIYYIISAKSIQNNPKFLKLASTYTHQSNGFYVEMNTNLLSFTQIVFIILFYFTLTFLVMIFFKRRVNHHAKTK